MGGYLFDTGILYLAGVSHKMWSFEDFVSDNLILKIVIHRTIDKLGQLGDGDGGDVAVVCVTLYFMIVIFIQLMPKRCRGRKEQFIIGPP